MNARIALSLILCLGVAVATVSAHDSCSSHACTHVQPKHHDEDCGCCPCDDCDEEGCECGKNCHKSDVSD